ncbi:MAG: carbohydrate kinase family protein [Treponema sp.]|nr:carbohydrate kinase family protein [Treponema sp.]
MAEKKYDIVGIADCCVDCAVSVDDLPTHNRGSRAHVMTFQGGGNVATGLVASARLGGEEKKGKIAAQGYVGSDDYGLFCKRDFEYHGIDSTYLQQLEGATTSVAIVLSDKATQGRSIMMNGGNIRDFGRMPPVQELLENCKWIYTNDFIEGNLEHIKMAKAAGAKLFIDSAAGRSYPHISLVDVFVGSEFAYNAIFPEDKEEHKNFEENCRKIRSQGPEMVVFTFGAKGCVGYSDDDGYFELPAFTGLNTICTLGCGDVYHGAFLMLLNLGYGCKDCARISSAVSAIKSTVTGGRAGIPDLPTTLKFIETGVLDDSDLQKRAAMYGRSLAHMK